MVPKCSHIDPGSTKKSFFSDRGGVFSDRGEFSGQIGGAPGLIKDLEVFVDFIWVDPKSIWEYFGTILDHFGTISTVKYTTQQNNNLLTVPRNLFYSPSLTIKWLTVKCKTALLFLGYVSASFRNLSQQPT